MKRVICIGNRYQPEDAAGPRVFDHLVGSLLPPDVAVLDGGLRGLDLLCYLEHVERVVFVDAVRGRSTPERIVVLTAAQVEAAAGGVYDHGAGLSYLLGAWRRVVEGPLPEIYLVGIVGLADAATVAAAAELCVSIAVRGYGQAQCAQLSGAGA